jgi:AcrR family transcriptional regulator
MSEKQATHIRREQIASAALAIAAEQGVAAITAKAVAERIGLAPSALYRHYKGKDDIIAAVLDMVGEYQKGNVAKALAHDDALDGLRSMLGGMADLFRANKALPLVFGSEVIWSGPAGHRERMHANFGLVRGALGELFARGQEQGKVRQDMTPQELTVFFVGLYLPPAMMSLRMPERIDFDAQIETNWTLFIRAIAPDPGDTHGESAPA